MLLVYPTSWNQKCTQNIIRYLEELLKVHNLISRTTQSSRVKKSFFGVKWGQKFLKFLNFFFMKIIVSPLGIAQLCRINSIAYESSGTAGVRFHPLGLLCKPDDVYT